MQSVLELVGPYHTDAQRCAYGPFRIELFGTHNCIDDVKIQSGYLSRNIERHLESVEWAQITPFVERLGYSVGEHYALLYLSALERALDFEPPDQIRRIRTIVIELVRCLNHFKYFEMIFNLLDMLFVKQQTQIHSEKIYDVLESLTGMRQLRHYFRLGGVAVEAKPGFQEKVNLVLISIRDSVTMWRDCILKNISVRERLSSIGKLHISNTNSLSLTGPSRRAFGENIDLRIGSDQWTIPLSYHETTFYKLQAKHNTSEPRCVTSVFDRVLQHIHEVEDSAQIVQELIEVWSNTMVKGHPVRRALDLPRIFKIKTSNVHSAIETARGQAQISIVSDGGRTPRSVSFKTPSESNMAAAVEAMIGNDILDWRLILASFDVCFSEVDR